MHSILNSPSSIFQFKADLTRLLEPTLNTPQLMTDIDSIFPNYLTPMLNRESRRLTSFHNATKVADGITKFASTNRFLLSQEISLHQSKPLKLSHKPKITPDLGKFFSDPPDSPLDFSL